MPKPRVNPPTLSPNGKVLGAPRKNPPPDAPRRIEKLASEGRGVVFMARAFKVSCAVFREWLKEDPYLVESIELGRENERWKLHNKLVQQAMKGNYVCGLFLLKTKHGYIEGQPPEQAARLHVTFSLPAAEKRAPLILEQTNGSTTAIALSEPRSKA